MDAGRTSQSSRRSLPPSDVAAGGPMARAIREHAAIAAAIESGDGARAAKAMGIHLDGLLADIPSIRRLVPDYFADDARAREPPVNGRKARPRLKRTVREKSHAEPEEVAVKTRPPSRIELRRAVGSSVDERRLCASGGGDEPRGRGRGRGTGAVCSTRARPPDRDDRRQRAAWRAPSRARQRPCARLLSPLISLVGRSCPAGAIDPGLHWRRCGQ